MSERVLPEGWVETTLGELNTHASRTFDPKKNPDVACELYSVPVFFDGQPEKGEGKEIGSTKQHVEPGDVLVCKINPRINRVWKVGKAREHLQIASSEWIVVRQVYCESRYLMHYFQSPGFRAMLCSDVSGVGGSLTRAKPKLVARYSVLVCSLSEQKIIADKLDELLAQVNHLKARMATIPSILKRFRQSVLAAAVSGKLTEQWRKENGLGPAEEVELGSLIHEGPQNGIYKPSSAYGEGVRIIRIDGFYDGELVPWSDMKRLEISCKELERWRVNPGDILINRVNSIEYLGKCALVRHAPGDAVFESNIMRFSVDPEKSIPEYVMRCLSSRPVKRQLVGKAKHAVNQASINQKDVKSCVIPLHHIEEQAEIVRRVDQLFAFADQVEQQVANAQARVDKLTQSILAKAFRGELTAEWRAENPELISGELSARALLERIKAEKAKQKPVGRGRKKAAAVAAGSSSFS